MSKQKPYREGWRAFIYSEMKRYRYLQKTKRIAPIDAEYRQAIQNCLEDLAEKPDGVLIERFLAMVYFDKTKTFDGAAFEIGVSRRTAQRWVNRFVSDVGKSVGGFF